MRQFVLVLSCLTLSTLSTFAKNQEEVKDIIKTMAIELESIYSDSKRVKVAILQFRTNQNSLTRFNHFIQDELISVYSKSNKFEVIEQNSVDIVTESVSWNLEKSQSYSTFTELSEQIFQNTGTIPDIYIYGLIDDNTDLITITIHSTPNGLSKSTHTVHKTIVSSEFTDLLLGK
ncbi:MAG TPA: hypothetical protein PL017_05175 [Tenuifilaceae bacterium]|nr:hypothetical protein [Tenuifilaceae bacterium]HPE18098.1 hypothetical protein [Tenuifilaceae bacterium]HPJ45468.1 hypothetical protein [Tenuifilaceae bacterium]HPQ33178.1 hypothetical protein [Tenuifilaceae bacterium]HRX67115.1 hypothetical protein [Tenuifilaceae bacterium]